MVTPILRVLPYLVIVTISASNIYWCWGNDDLACFLVVVCGAISAYRPSALSLSRSLRRQNAQLPDGIPNFKN
jgi:hypothetical protein